MNMRKDADIILETDISNDVKDKKIPRFILQPMIENSIIHGLDESDGKIHLQAFYEEDYLIIIISDNGKGMDSLTLENLRKNIVILSSYGTHSNKSGFSSLGLPNVYERLFMGFGPDVEIKIDSTIYKGTKITLKIPKHRGEDYNMDY